MFSRIAILSSITLATLTSSALADCKSEIQEILKSVENAPPYRMEMDAVSAGQSTKMLVEAIMPHSIRMKGEGISMVMTPNGVWMDQGTGALQKMPDAMKDQIQGMIRQGMNLGVQAVDLAECPGAADYEGKSYTLYKYAAKANFMGVDSFSNVAMYVNDNGRPEWLVVDGEAMGVKSVTTQKITYDNSIKIADPQ
jgi:hypothetical protein